MTSHPERDLSGPPEGEVEAVGGPSEDEGTEEEAEAFPSIDATDAVDVAAAEILTDVAALTAERDEYLNALQRTQADFANYRKRVLRQQDEQGDRGVLDLVGKLLPVLDTLDLAIAHLETGNGETARDPDVPSVEAEALRQIRAMLIDTLAKDGLERVDAAGVPFDPAVHDAVAHAEDNGSAEEDPEPGPKVDLVMRSGYRWRGRTVRPAMVRVRG